MILELKNSIPFKRLHLLNKKNSMLQFKYYIKWIIIVIDIKLFSLSYTFIIKINGEKINTI